MVVTLLSMAVQPSYGVAINYMGITYNIDLKIVPGRLVKSNVVHYCDFLELRFDTTLR